MGTRITGRRPSPALLVAVTALVFSLGGVATGLPGKKTVDKNDLAKNVVKSKHIKRGNVKPRDLANPKRAELDLINDWEPFGEGTAAPAAFKDGFGVVHLEGVIRRDSAFVADAFIVPQGFRPPHGVFEPVNAGPFETGRVVIQPSGDATVVGPTEIYDFTSLDGVSYRADN